MATGPEPDVCEDEPTFAVTKVAGAALAAIATGATSGWSLAPAPKRRSRPPRLDRHVTGRTASLPHSRKPQLAPEATHQTREVAVIDGITTSSALWPRRFTIERRVGPQWSSARANDGSARRCSEKDVSDRIGSIRLLPLTPRTQTKRITVVSRRIERLATSGHTHLGQLFRVFPKYTHRQMVPLGTEHNELKESSATCNREQAFDRCAARGGRRTEGGRRRARRLA